MTYQELKEKAKELGVDVSGQPNKAELEVLVQDAEEAKTMAAKEATFEKPNEEAKKAVQSQISDAAKKVNARQAAMLMKKVKITPLDERMRGLPSEYFSVGNKHIGFISKVVRFNKPTWEPECILQLLREKKMIIQESETINGKEVVIKREVEAYAISEVALTPEEKAELAASKKK